MVRRAQPRPAGRAPRRCRALARSVGDVGQSRASVAAHYDAVSSIYRLVHEEELIDHNPGARISPPKGDRELQRGELLTVLQYAAFLSTARALGTTHHAVAVLGGMLGAADDRDGRSDR